MGVLMERMERVASQVDALADRVELFPCEGANEFDAAKARYAENARKQ